MYVPMCLRDLLRVMLFFDTFIDRRPSEDIFVY